MQIGKFRENLHEIFCIKCNFLLRLQVLIIEVIIMKILAIFLSIMMLAACTGNQPEVIEENARAVMVNDRIYYDTGIIPERLPTCGMMDGEITSSVAEDELPTQNGESNFGAGYRYQNYDHNEIIIPIDAEEWYIFRCDDVWGLNLSVKDITPTGLTLLIEQKDGEIKGELHTGSYFFVEEQKDGLWHTLESKVDAWTQVAYMVRENDITELEVNWEYVYGELPAGHYRIGKEISDWIAPGEYEKATYVLEFTIE